jgi:hypothetical protein
MHYWVDMIELQHAVVMYAGRPMLLPTACWPSDFLLTLQFVIPALSLQKKNAKHNPKLGAVVDSS